ncbi:MAG: benzoate transporter [Proteobacteria bacterium]|mgnify:CR=1 FL=1|nr:MAG: benzoate transporter [Pseudomonadota bacterium]
MSAKGEKFQISLRELSGALGDLGTLLPLTLGVIAVAGLAPTPIFLGFGIFYVATALYYRLPIPVQPMKAVAAVMLTTEVTASGLAASGVIIGLTLLLLGVTGWISRLARLVPQSVLAGLQLGLGIALAIVSLELMATEPLVGAITAGLLIVLLFFPRYPSALTALLVAVVLGWAMGATRLELAAVSATISIPPWPSLQNFEQAVSVLVVPQLSLTLTNAVLLTALIASDYFGERAAHVTPARLSITSGLANLVLTPFGALPMCHGAGGLAAHYRFGARSGAAPLFLGLLLIALALWPGNAGLMTLAAIPAAGLGALLLIASGELALTKRLFDCKPSCWPVIATTAAVTVWADPFWGLLVGSGAELVRQVIVRALTNEARR